MSCEIRSMMTSYFFGSSMRMPPIFTNSAVTPAVFDELIFSTKAGGNVFSIPKRIPIFLATALSCRNALSNPRHPELSLCCAKRGTNGAEGPLHPLPPPQAIPSPCVHSREPRCGNDERGTTDNQ